MARRRGHHEGSIYRRADGRWCAAITLDHGQRRAFYGRTRREAAEKLAAASRALADGLPVVSDRLLVGPFLEDWLEAAKPGLADKTHVGYCVQVSQHIVPELGRVPLAKLSPQHLHQLYTRKTRKLEAGLAPGTVRHLHAVLRRALGQAERWGLVPRNVARLVTPPRAPRRQMAVLSPEEARRFLAAAAGTRVEALFVLALTTGLRQGELLGLRWADVDLASSHLRVTGSLQRSEGGLVVGMPKTSTSRRRVKLTPTAVDALRRHRVAQAEERLRMGPAWQDDDLVFTTQIGTPIHAISFVRREFQPLLEKAGLPRIRFHDLRHTAATLLLGQGVHPKIVSEMLGHASVGITLDLYSPVTADMQAQAAEAMEAVCTR